ncbi:MAG: hypothetical protein ACFHWX_10835 [Bacteroidota bacterium]
MKNLAFFFILLLMLVSCSQNPDQVIVLKDDFSELPRGPMLPDLGAHTEYHYIHEAAPKGNWAVSTFYHHNGFVRAWRVREINGERHMEQSYTNRANFTHPIVISGNEFWEDYTFISKFTPLSLDQQVGVVFRYHNDRCYYFFGIKDNELILKKVNHASGFHQPDEEILASHPFKAEENKELKAEITVKGNSIQATINNMILTAEDSTFTKGKIGLMADVPCAYNYVKVTMEQPAFNEFQSKKVTKEKEEADLQAANPKMKVWKKIRTNDFGMSRNLRFGDLDGDGQTDILIGQVMHHGPKDRNSELSCLTAINLEGERLWQIGQPDPWKNNLTNDVAFQIHDIDNDGKNEVIYSKDFELIIADGATGKTKYKTSTPASPNWEPNLNDHNKFTHILGDCLYFCDLSGKGYDSDIIVKDRYHHIWAYNAQLKPLWHVETNTGHYPYAFDIDNDGKDELMAGYSLMDDNGEMIWDLSDEIKDHADGVAIVNFDENQEPKLLCAASDEGMFFTNMKGEILKHYYVGHVQNPAIANLRDDLPGLEAVSINFWGNQGIMHFYDAESNIYHDFEPNQMGSMCLPLNWTGDSEEFIVHNPNVDIGGVFDGWGRKVLDFPDDGHPDMCNAVLDIMGDARDEIVVWDPHEIWIYTQEDNPKQGKLYDPIRNPLYNYSNYQVTVSLPGWNE